MFCTLKYSEMGNELHHLDTTTSLSSKKREGKLAKVACTNCRASKLKCSGEIESCRRCLEKKIRCHYTSPQRPNSSGSVSSMSSMISSSRGRSRRQRTAPSSPSEATPQSRAPTTPDVGSPGHHHHFSLFTSDPAFSDGNQTMGLDFGMDMPEFFTPRDAGAMLFPDDDYMKSSSTSMVTEPWSQQLLFSAGDDQMDEDMFCDDVNGELDLYSPYSSTTGTTDAVATAATTASHQTEASNNNPPFTFSSLDDADGRNGPGSCPCFFRAVTTHETVEAAAWLQKELLSKSDDVLQHQKEALAECEELLGCERCRDRPEYAMLLLSVCGKILNTLERLRCCRHSHDSATFSSSASSSSLSTDHGQQQQQQQQHQGGGGDTVSPHDDDKSWRRGLYGTKTRGRGLDEDDRHIVLQSLVTSRANRLDGVLAALDQLVGRHSWPVHRGLVRELQSRLAHGSLAADKGSHSALGATCEADMNTRL